MTDFNYWVRGRLVRIWVRTSRPHIHVHVPLGTIYR